MIKASLRQLCIISIFCGAALSISPEGSVKRIMNILVTAVLILAVISPFKIIDFDFYSLELAKLKQNESVLAEKGAELSKRINRLSIDDEYKAYIMDKAAKHNIEITELKLDLKWSTEGLWVPESFYAEYSGDIQKQKELSGILSAELGISADKQYWRKNEGA